MSISRSIAFARMSDSIETGLTRAIKHLKSVDESTKARNNVQHAIFLRNKDTRFHVTENLFDMVQI